MLHEHVANALKNHRLYAEFIQVKNSLAAHGCVCWIAGGAVRDFLLSRLPLDLDLVTDATTTQLLQIFPKAIPVGVQFGVVKLPLPDGETFDLATFRRESDYIDGRRPSRVDFATAAEDAQRRDFTINALFWDDKAQRLVDYTSGLADITSRLLKCVGDPATRFQEDHLRVLRLLRFQVQLGFQIQSQTRVAALTHVSDLNKISGERIWSEIQKMIPFINWSLFLDSSLAEALLAEIFPLKKTFKQVNLASGKYENEFSKVAFFYFLVEAAQSLPEMQSRLRDRLHFSKSDYRLFESICFCTAKSFSTEEWVLEAEKNILILDILRLFSLTGKWAVSDWICIETLFKSRPPKIVNGDDLKGLIPVEKMGEVLKKIRLLQLKQPDLDKQSLLKLI